MPDVVTLKNGLRIVYEQIPYVRSIAFGIWVKSGSRDENTQTSGMSHFIEHMMFKGTEKRTAKTIADEMDAVGGQINAYTSKEYTCYHTLTLDTHFDIAVDILSDMFFNSKFSNEELKKERNVILEEISMYEDSPEELVYDILQESVWHPSSLAYPILGTKESIGAFDSGKMKTFHKENYLPNKTVISVAGNFKVDEMVGLLTEKFGLWEASNYNSDIGEKSVSFCSGFNTKVKDIEQVHLCIGFPGIPVGTDESYTLAVFNTIFGGGMSSKLFQKIREERGLTYSIYSFATNYKDVGLFSIYAGMNTNQTAEVINLIKDEINSLKSEKLSTDQISRTKEQLKSNLIIGQESTSSRMTSLGRSLLLLNRIPTVDDIIEKIDKVGQSELKDLIQKIFFSNKINVSAVGKVDGMNLEEMFT